MLKNLRTSNPRKMIFFGVVFAGMSLLLILLARDIIREAIVLPLSYLFWLLGVVLDTTPQIVFWISVLMIAALAAYRSLVGRRKPVAQIPLNGSESPGQREYGGQVAHWALRVHLIRRGPSPYFVSAFHQSVNRLLMDELSHRYRLTARQIEDRLREGDLDVPPEVRDYVLGALRRYDGEERPFLADLWARITQLVRDLLGKSSHRDGENGGGNTSPEEEKVRAVLKYLENELEVSNDDTGR